MKSWREYEHIGAECHDKGDSAGAAEAYMQAAMSDEYLRSQRTHYSNYLFALHYLSGITNEEMAHEHFIYNSLYREVEQFETEVTGRTIGYIAETFVESSVARFIEAMIMQHSGDFTVKVFSLTNESDEFTERIRRRVDKYIELNGKTLEESSELIESEQVDILFDLSGHSDGGMTLQILGYKPAAVQIVGIGWTDTTGLETIDYVLTDSYLAPIGSEKYFSEKLLRLSGGVTFTPTEQMRKLHTTHSVGTITFGSFNNFMKVTDEYLEVVRRIMSKVPETRFILQDTTTLPERKTEMVRRISELKLPTERVEVRLGRADYLKDYGDVDIMLDTFPYNGGFMTATALYMGVPVISLQGERQSSRYGANILRLAGVVELIANDITEYVELATKLATDRECLTDFHLSLRERLEQSKLLDSAGYVNELEFCYDKLLAQR